MKLFRIIRHLFHLYPKGGIVKHSFKPEWAVVDGVRVCINSNPSEIVLTKEQCEALTELAKQPFPADAPIINYNDLKVKI